MNFDELRDELSARGFSHMSTTRLGSLVNRAMHRLDSLAPWPYREDSAQGTAPLSVASMGWVEAVSNEDQEYPLEEIGYSDLVEWGCDLSESGSPRYWYHSRPGGVPVINTWPTNSDTIGVQFWKISADLSLDADEPDLPDRYHLLIVDMAQQQAERDRGNFQAAQLIQPEIDRQVSEMMDDLLQQQAPKFVRFTGASEDW